MITSFEVGAVFKILDDASPALRRILKQVRDLNLAINKARENLSLMNKTLVPASMVAAVGETEKLALAWKNVAKQSAAATRAIGQASAAAKIAVPTLPAIPAPAGGGGGGRHRPGFRGGAGGGGSSGVHVSGPRMSMPGGSHISFRGGGGTALAATAGLLGYGAYEDAQMEDAVWQLIYHSGQQQNGANRDRFRKVLQDSMSESGYSLHDISESAKQEIRMFQGTPGGGLDVLPEMLRAATIEARLKGESPEESMKALIGLAHMTKQYDPEAIKKLAPAFAYLSTANPGSLSSIEKAAGYAVPILQSSMGIEPIMALLMGTALTRAGATSTKSGTWLREMALRAMPGTAIFQSEKAAEHHDELLKRLGLLDGNEKPTWFTGGKPDLFKMLDIAGTNIEKIPMAERAGVERKLFGAQGSGGLALLTDPAVHEQIRALMKEMTSPEFKNRYGSFVPDYKEGSPMQQGRTTIADFQNVMMDLGKTVLPSVVGVMKDIDGTLKAIRSILPGGKDDDKNKGADKWKVGTRALEGAALGATWGMLGGPGGAAGGALAGGAVGGLLGIAEGVLRRDMTQTGDAAAAAASSIRNMGDAIRGIPSRPGILVPNPGAASPMGYLQGPPKATKAQPISLSLNIDGRTLAQAMSDQIADLLNFPTGAPAANGLQQWHDGDHNLSST